MNIPIDLTVHSRATRALFHFSVATALLLAATLALHGGIRTTPQTPAAGILILVV